MIYRYIDPGKRSIDELNHLIEQLNTGGYEVHFYAIKNVITSVVYSYAMVIDVDTIESETLLHLICPTFLLEIEELTDNIVIEGDWTHNFLQMVKLSTSAYIKTRQ